MAMGWTLQEIETAISTEIPTIESQILASAVVNAQNNIIDFYDELDLLFINNGDFDHRADPVNAKRSLGDFQANIIGILASINPTQWADNLFLAVGQPILDRLGGFAAITADTKDDTIDFGEAIGSTTTSLLPTTDLAVLVNSNTYGIITKHLRSIRIGIDDLLRKYFNTSGMQNNIEFNEDQIEILEIIAGNDTVTAFPYWIVLKEIDKLYIEFNAIPQNLPAVTPDIRFA